MKHIYVLTSGEYSDYRIEGVVVSDAPIDWPTVKEKMAAWLNENLGGDSWYLSAEQEAAMLAAAGLSWASYDEVTFEPRHWDEIWRFID